jgi:uncharacterized protein YbaP (TraB family)
MAARILRSVLPVLLLAPALALAAASSDEAPLPELETFVVSGEQPGPALWKVTRKDHTLWILPTYGPLPAQLVWKSRQVEDVIRGSQEVYALAQIPVERPDDVKSRTRMFKAVMNIDGKALVEVMPPDLHRRFVQLSEKYAGGSAPFERFRPFQAVDLLQDAAMNRLQLTSDGGVHDTVRRLADRHGVKYMTFQSLGSGTWERLISDLEKTPRDADVACAQARMDRLESDLREAVDRANAWARGDLSELRHDVGLLNGGPDMVVCRQFFQHMKSVRQALQAMRRKSYSAYEKALKRNRSTLVLISIGDLFDADGLLAMMKKGGYRIDEP